MSNRFTQKAQEALNAALRSAQELGHGYIGTEHILLGLTQVEDSVATQVLAAEGVTASGIVEKIMETVGTGTPSSVTPQDMTPRTKKVLQQAFFEARGLQSSFVGTEHLLLALLKEQDSKAFEILTDLEANPAEIFNAVLDAIGAAPVGAKASAQKKPTHKDTPTLDNFGRDLTEMAADGKIDPVIGRKNEIERVIQILSRRTKNNPCLIGEPGVGKTAVAEGLAQRITDGDVPETLRDKRVVSLDLASMIAGAKYRGDFEERIKNAVAEVTKAGNVIVFIDELHTIIGAGSAEGAVDAANILKPSLARGELQVIGATTLNEYKKHIETDAALERRFQPVIVNEPTQEDAIDILKGIRDKYEAHHKVKITDEAIVSAVKLSARYIQDRFLPDKAIDLMDEAASKVRLSHLTPSGDIKALEEKLAKIKSEKDAAVCHEDFEAAAKFKEEERKLSADLESAKKEWSSDLDDSSVSVTSGDIEEIICAATGIPVKRLVSEESERLLKLDEILHQRVVGQDEAVTSVAKAIRRGRVGLKDPKRPVGSFIFLGPTGVGKTELSKALSEVMFGDEGAMIRIDMSEYMEKHTVSRLIGSPPGYVGFDDGGQLTEKVRRKPYSVILFDEIEKAHPDVFNILLQILDDGILTDGKGRKVDFKNTVIIMTSNVGAKNITETLHFGFAPQKENTVAEQERLRSDVMGELKRTFRPEFLNRVDDIIVFKRLTREDTKEICKRLLKGVFARLEEKDITLKPTEELYDFLAEKGFDQAYGARPLKRAIQTYVEDTAAEKILDGSLKASDVAVVTAEDGNVVFNITQQ